MLSIPLASLKSTPHTGKANQSISSNAAVRLDYFACHCKNFCLSTPSRLFSSPAKLKLKLVHNHLKPHFSSCSMYVQDQHSRPILSYVLASTLVTTGISDDNHRKQHPGCLKNGRENQHPPKQQEFRYRPSL